MIGGLLGLGLAVAVGSLAPVLPTGALVATSSVVALAAADPLPALAGVFAAAALGAFVGDAVLLVLAQVLGGPFLHRWARRIDPAALDRARHRLADHYLGVLTISRLLPAGRVPVLAAVVLVSFPARRFLLGNVLAVGVWALCYVVLGGIGASLLPTVWEGVLAAVLLVMALAAVPTLVGRLRHRHDREVTGDRQTGAP